MNAMEHGNKYQPDRPVAIQVSASSQELAVSITDQGGELTILEAASPDLDAKLEGLQTPRGWGLFLIQNMVDEVRTVSDGQDHTIELVVSLGGGQDA
jgi:anti-sigma regulatory factor (Ser/Thr protein kinase)